MQSISVFGSSKKYNNIYILNDNKYIHIENTGIFIENKDNFWLFYDNSLSTKPVYALLNNETISYPSGKWCSSYLTNDGPPSSKLSIHNPMIANMQYTIDKKPILNSILPFINNKNNISLKTPSTFLSGVYNP